MKRPRRKIANFRPEPAGTVAAPTDAPVPFRQQIIVATPHADEAESLSAWLDAEGFDVIKRPTAKGASDAVMSQPFDLLVADAGFVLTGGVRGFGLARFRETPVIVLGDAAGSRACAPFGPQMMFLERPIEQGVFVCTVTMALMEARPERRSPRHPVLPFSATVNGVESRIIDVSREGVRLEMPRERRMVTPQFVMRVPMMGVGVAVQRRWVRMPNPGDQEPVMWCGGELYRNTVLAEQAWHRFIDTLLTVSAAPSTPEIASH
jgi:hypothetical protein